MECHYVRTYSDIIEIGSFLFTGWDCIPLDISRSIYLYPELVEAYHKCRGTQIQQKKYVTCGELIDYNEFVETMSDAEWACFYYDVCANDFHWEGHIEKFVLFAETFKVFPKPGFIYMFLPTIIMSNNRIIQRIERSLSHYSIQILPSYVQYKCVFQGMYSVLNDQLIIETEYNSYVAYFIEQNATAKRQTALLSKAQIMEYCKPLAQDFQHYLMNNSINVTEDDKMNLLNLACDKFLLWDDSPVTKIELSGHRFINAESIKFNKCLSRARNNLISDAFHVTCCDFNVTNDYILNVVFVGFSPLAKYVKRCYKQLFPSLTQIVDEFSLFCKVLNRNILFFSNIDTMPPSPMVDVLQAIRVALEDIMSLPSPSLAWGELCQKGFTRLHRDIGDCNEFRIEDPDSCLGISLIENKSPQVESKEKYFIPGVVPSYLSMNVSAVEDDSRIIIGSLRDGQYDGPCTTYYISKPLIYKGNLKEGKRSGFGSVLYSGQLIWKGNYKNNQIEGSGHCFASDGTSYVGNFQNGEFHGVGCLMHCGCEVNTGGYSSGTWEGFHFVSSPSVITYGQIQDSSWNRDVIRFHRNGNAVVDFYHNGILDDFSVGFTTQSMLTPHTVVSNIEDNSLDEELEDPIKEGLLTEDWGELEGDEDENKWVCEVEYLLSQNQSSDDEGFKMLQNKLLNKNEAPAATNSSIDEPNLFPFSKKGGKVEWLKKNEGRYWDSQGTLLYEAHFEKDMFSSKGTLFYPDGKIWYEGEFRNDKPHGKGKLYYPNGCLRYNGEWKNGLMHGTGRQFKPINFKYANAAIRSYVLSNRNVSVDLSFASDFSRYNDLFCV